MVIINNYFVAIHMVIKFKKQKCYEQKFLFNMGIFFSVSVKDLDAYATGLPSCSR